MITIIDKGNDNNNSNNNNSLFYNLDIGFASIKSPKSHLNIAFE